MDTETKINIVIILIVFLIIFFICFWVCLLIFQLLKFLRNKLKLENKYLSNKSLKYYLLICSFIFSIYQSYTAVYPNDSFYYKEFEYVTNQKIPNSAKIINKKSSYPDFHGDYFSKSEIKLSEQDFNMLLEKLQNDKTLIETKPYKKNELRVFERKIKGESDRFLFIHFLNDNKTILVNVDFT
ncbi:hypothetical protein G6R40_02575 [Chryseobacterium sp. POL2]|uniref:hypothetical protein n=1 Tax=Chryseobacterium sp. POL2 TaxID=2713414 RepID=UPI0013E1AC76|nr:hypothetical protein [Chryseobacterium sp. POL2]QIG88616.1 hypothetical protein G6R40_02575 [Chryseobacterium sp. POL2]